MHAQKEKEGRIPGDGNDVGAGRRREAENLANRVRGQSAFQVEEWRSGREIGGRCLCGF